MQKIDLDYSVPGRGNALKLFIFLLVGIFIGFYSHDYVLFHLPVSPVNTVKNAVILPDEKAEDPNNNFINSIRYENGKFNPSTLTMRKGNYLIVSNNSDSKMWLVSTLPELNTPRGYGNGEEKRVKPEKEGTYTITNKLNIEAKAIIRILP